MRKSPEEIAAVELLMETAASFDRFCEALVPLTEWRFGSVYNLLITFDELRCMHENDSLMADPRDVLVRLARADAVAGPYDDEGHSSQAVADELSIALEQLDTI